MSTAFNLLHLNHLIVVFNLGKHSAYSVPAEDRQRHERCVYFALDTLPDKVVNGTVILQMQKYLLSLLIPTHALHL